MARWSFTVSSSASLLVVALALQSVALPVYGNDDTLEIRGKGFKAKNTKQPSSSYRGANKKSGNSKYAARPPAGPAQDVTNPDGDATRDVSDEAILFARGKTATKGAPPKNKVKPPVSQGGQGIKVKDVKKSSSTYRNAAAKSDNSVYSVSGGALTITKGDGTVKKGMDADHGVEAQTIAAAINKAKIPPPAAAIKEIKDIANSPQNMAFLDKTTNIQKGATAKAAAKGLKTTTVSYPLVKAYLQDIKTTSENTADKMDAILKKHGSDASVRKEHDAVLRINGVIKRAVIEWLLDELD